MQGLIPGDLRVTCTACAGTLLLEFGALSRMTGQPVYESLARRAVEVVYGEFSRMKLCWLSTTVPTDLRPGDHEPSQLAFKNCMLRLSFDCALTVQAFIASADRLSQSLRLLEASKLLVQCCCSQQITMLYLQIKLALPPRRSHVNCLVF